jgi:dephospho-CoA kinase
MKTTNNKPFTVALTGTIGSGKTSALNWFRKRGYESISADEISHKLLLSPEIKTRIVNAFGMDILQGEEIDRKKLGSVVFSEEKKLKILNDILHPEIIKEIKQRIEVSNNKILVFEIPLLFEAGIEKLFNLTINVIAEPEVRIKRVENRDSVTEESIRKRSRFQLTDEIKQKKADINVDNNCSINCFYHQLRIVDSFIQRMARK